LKKTYRFTVGEILDELRSYPDDYPAGQIIQDMITKQIVQKIKQRERTERFRKKEKKNVRKR